MDGLFGKQRGYLDRIRKEDVAVESIGSILRSLSALPQEAWMKYAFSREPLNGRFTDAERIALGEKADACGRFYGALLFNIPLRTFLKYILITTVPHPVSKAFHVLQSARFCRL